MSCFYCESIRYTESYISLIPKIGQTEKVYIILKEGRSLQFDQIQYILM